MSKSDDEIFDEWWYEVGSTRDTGSKHICNDAFLAGRASMAEEISKLREQRERLVVIAREYARVNPHHDYKGVQQDPNGVHKIIAAIESETASSAGGNDCPECEGLGYDMPYINSDAHVKCDLCKGTGRVSK